MSRSELEKFLGRSRSWIYSVIDPKSTYFIPDFPQPIRLGGNSIAWIQTEVLDWVESRMAQRPVRGAQQEPLDAY